MKQSLPFRKSLLNTSVCFNHPNDPRLFHNNKISGLSLLYNEQAAYKPELFTMMEDNIIASRLHRLDRIKPPTFVGTHISGKVGFSNKSRLNISSAGD